MFFRIREELGFVVLQQLRRVLSIQSPPVKPFAATHRGNIRFKGVIGTGIIDLLLNDCQNCSKAQNRNRTRADHAAIGGHTCQHRHRGPPLQI
jgi:hypothetical protein